MTDLPSTAVLDQEQAPVEETRINDVTIHVATVNGSGSQSSNNVLMRSIFQMGVPVSGKNMFPSNIAGLPTWFTIRANRDGWIGRKKEVDILVAMNAATARDDVMALDPGSICIYDEPLDCRSFREDALFYPVPFAKLAGELSTDSRLRKLLANMIYVGIVAELVGIEREELIAAVEKQFKGKKKAVELNVQAIDKGLEYAKANLDGQRRWTIQRMDATKGKIIIDGNAAAAIGAMFGGVTVVTWYPITPSSSLCESLIDYMKRYRVKDGKATFAIVQAEDELAAVGMVLGAGWAGARSMTSTSGPGVSLMAEFIGLGYFAEIPGVIWDIQRVGPSTGLPTRTAQGDILSATQLSHGDTQHISLIPGSIEECFEFAIEALDLAEMFQTPVFVLSDLDIGMNDWMVPRLKWDDGYRPDRGKVLGADELERLERFSRYLDVDGDGVAARTLPGVHPRGAFFTRGSGHNKFGGYTEDAAEYADVMLRLGRKMETAIDHLPAPEIRTVAGAAIGIVSLGGCHRAVLEAMETLDARGVPADYMRVRAFPFSADVSAFLREHERIFVVEQNRDGQLASLLAIETGFPRPRLEPVGTFGGLPLSARDVVDGVLEALGAEGQGS